MRRRTSSRSIGLPDNLSTNLLAEGRFEACDAPRLSDRNVFGTIEAYRCRQHRQLCDDCSDPAADTINCRSLSDPDCSEQFLDLAGLELSDRESSDRRIRVPFE